MKANFHHSRSLMNMSVNPETGHSISDLKIIGGGVNGCGNSRDAAGRGLSVTLFEMNDLGGATCSASTKLFHWGLRYLEYFKFKIVRASLIERKILLCSMPHISWFADLIGKLMRNYSYL